MRRGICPSSTTRRSRARDAGRRLGREDVAIDEARNQFAFVVSFHIIFPAFTIGLAAWLATLEGTRLATGNPVYRRVFDFWLKVFALSFGVGVVTGIVMFSTNWSVLAERTGPIQGPLLGYEGFTAFLLEATDRGIYLGAFAY